MAREIFEILEVMNAIAVIADREESRYTDIPGWDGKIEWWTEKAVKFQFKNGHASFIPFSQLRKAEDGQSIYASEWILQQKGII